MGRRGSQASGSGRRLRGWTKCFRLKLVSMGDERRERRGDIPILHDQALRKTVVPTGTIFPSYENSLTVDLGSDV